MGFRELSSNLSLRNSGPASSRVNFLIREDDPVKKMLCSVDFDVYLRTRSIFPSETVELRVLKRKKPIREDDLVKTAMYRRF